jgi:Zn-dependent peptidase ImmA (M78 family)
MAKDYIVRYRSDASIAQLTKRILEAAGMSFSPNFSITKLIRFFERNELGQKKEKLTINLLPKLPRGKKYAYVSFNPLTLHCENNIWIEAEIGEPKAREILAHELGHIVLHDHFAKPYSDADSSRLRSVEPQKSAESQATLFADNLLLPDCYIKSFGSREQLLENLHIPEDMIDRRLLAFEQRKPYTGEMCRACNSITLMRVDLDQICDMCGASVGCL